MFARPLLLGLFAITLSTTACRQSEIASYRVPKEKDALPVADLASPAMPSVPAGGGMAATPVATASGDGLTWSAPAHWKSKPPAPMRKATFVIPGDGGAEAELSITAFPGDVGGELANVNRWRGQAQIQLPPIAQADLAAVVTRHENAGLKFGIVDFTSTASPAQRVLGAWVPFAGGTWFFKLTGPEALLAKEKPAFLAFLDSIKPAAGSP